MLTSICFKCGAAKSNVFNACQRCGVVPRTNSERAVSLALSSHLSSKEQRTQYSHVLGAAGKVSVPREVLVRALGALKDPQLRAKLESQSSDLGFPGPTVSPNQPMPEAQVVVRDSIQRKPTSTPPPWFATTELVRSPFMVLGATTRDNRRRIVELADEKSLDLDQAACQKARSDLTNPRTRLGAEMSWLPGVSPGKAFHLIQALQQDPIAVRNETGLPTLAHLNLEAAVFESLGDQQDPDDMASFIAEFASLADDLDPEEVFRDVNEDRSVSGFPAVQTVEQVETALTDRKRHYRDSIKRALDNFPTSILIRVMTDAVDDATCGGTQQSSSLIDDLVNSYEVETQSFLQEEADNAEKLIKAAREVAAKGEPAIKPYVDKLDAVARNWDTVAQPIQLSAKARGMDHEPSRKLAYSIRSLAIDLYKQHDMLAQTQRLTTLLQELFAEIPEVVDRLQLDANELATLSALEPFRTLCEKVIEDIGRYPNSANKEGQRLLGDGRALLARLSSDTDSSIREQANDMIALTVTQCAVAYGNETSEWPPCVLLLQSALNFASDKDIQKRINDNLDVVRNNQAELGGFDPIREAPSLRTTYGIGFTLYGKSESRSSDCSYVAAYYFVVFLIPVIPIARYRVIPINGGYRFLAKGKIEGGDIWRSVVSVGLVVLGLLIL